MDRKQREDWLNAHGFHNVDAIVGAKPLDDQPVLSSDMLQLTKWVGEYYGSSWGEAIENALPRWVKYGKNKDLCR